MLAWMAANLTIGHAAAALAGWALHLLWRDVASPLLDRAMQWLATRFL